MERKLATIQRIKEINPIKDADRIEVATVNGWKVVVAKDVGHEVGDLVVYCEIDSFLPVRDEFEFLRKSSYTEYDGKEGFRLRTAKLRGQVSQGLVLPLSIFEGYGYDVITVEEDETISYTGNEIALTKQLDGGDVFYMEYNIGDDVSDILDIVKYDPPLPEELEGKAKGYFPSYIQKTSQERIQNLSDDYNELEQKRWVATEKLNGESATFYINNGEFGVCTRRIEMLRDENNVLWNVARVMEIEDRLKAISEYLSDFNIALQGELIGEGIKGNPYNIIGKTIKFFDIFNITEQKYLDPSQFKNSMTHVLDFKGSDMVPIIDSNMILPNSVDELIEYADGKSILNKSVAREGLVFKNMEDGNESFKVISNKFLLNE